MGVIINIKKVYFRLFGRMHNYLNANSYMKHYLKYLKQ